MKYKLDNELAAEWGTYGLKIYQYFEDEEDGTLRQETYGNHIIVGPFAQHVLVEVLCDKIGPCDTLKDMVNLHLAKKEKGE